MKQLKRICALAIVLVLCLGFAGTASASKYNGSHGTTATYSGTQSFLDAMDDAGIIYTYQGLDSDEDDWVEISYSGDYCDNIDLDVYFSSDNDRASYRFWNMIDFNSSDYREGLVAVNQLNYDYKWVTFYVDTTDYSVTVSLDTLFPAGNAGSICLESLDQIVNISDIGYHALEPYIKNP